MTYDLNNAPEKVDTGNDSIVIVNHVQGVPGGRTLDVTGFSGTVIKAGHVIIKNASGVHKPMPVSGSAYGSLPASHSYVGVLASTILTSKPSAPILLDGTVNEAASPYPVTSDMKTALSHILFIQD